MQKIIYICCSQVALLVYRTSFAPFLRTHEDMKERMDDKLSSSRILIPPTTYKYYVHSDIHLIYDKIKCYHFSSSY